MNQKGNGRIFKLPSNRTEAIIFLCGFFSFFTTWAGAYKVTSFFSEMPFLGIEEDVLHTSFSLFTAITIFHIIFSILMNNMERSISESEQRSSTPFILAATTVIALSFWLSVEGLTEGYKNFRTAQILTPYQGEEARFMAAVKEEVFGPVERLTQRLKAKRASLNEQEKQYMNLSDQLEILEQEITMKQEQFSTLNQIRTDSLRVKYEWRITNLRNTIDRLFRKKQQLQQQRNRLAETTKLKEMNRVTEQLSAYRFGKTSPSTLVAHFSRGETLLGQNLDFGFKQDKLEELHAVKVALTNIQTNYHSFLSVIREGLQRNEAGSRGFIILILFFALLGDIVPLLISLKNSNPNTIHGLFKESVQWFHSITDEIAKVDFVRRISHACVGFLFTIDQTDQPRSFKRRYLEPVSRWITLEPLALSFNFLLAITIIWGLMSLVIDETYYLQLSQIFDGWTTDLLSWVEELRF
ncbi:MAG: hypothetical protein HRU41_07875 [Saprospiraceae bacterium]|nr:hypothetical protein [Saprospiraceae bacterium]